MKAHMAVGVGTAGVESVSRYLSFAVANEIFGINILSVKEIIEYGEVKATHIPRLPPMIRGAINLRGKAVPIVDLALRLEFSAVEITRRSCIVIVELNLQGNRLEMGIVVDAVQQVISLTEHDIEPPPTFGGEIRADFIAGMAKMDKSFMIILDITRVLSLADVEVLHLVERQDLTNMMSANIA